MRRDGRAEEHTVEGDVRGHKDLIEAILKKMAEGMAEDSCI
jgi:hypothetical protein